MSARWLHGRRLGRMVLGIAFALGAGVVPVPADEPAPALDESRREFRTAGLVVETGARTSSCDALLFTRDGKQLLAAGDDKVVRTWDVTPQGLRPPREHLPVLRWPSYRENFGNIRALALSPDPGQEQVVVVGHGGWFSHGFEAAVLDRKTGKLTQALSPNRAKLPAAQKPYMTSLWSAAFAPSGQRVALGTMNGGVWLWDFGSPTPRFVGAHQAAREAPGIAGRVVFLTFAGENRLISADGRGELREWTLLPDGTTANQLLFQFDGELTAVTASPDGRQLAAILAWSANQPGRVVQIVALPNPGGISRRLVMPNAAQHQVFPHRLAFSADGQTLAVALRWVGHTEAPARQADFFQELGGQVCLFNLNQPNPQPRAGPEQSLYAEGLAFDPTNSDRLAIAGGDDHEVRLWDVRQNEPIGPAIRSPGHGLWGVKLDAKGRYIAFQQERHPAAPHPNQRGRGPWRYFDLKYAPDPKNPCHFVDADEAEQHFVAQDGKAAAAGWTVHFRKPGAPVKAAQWYVEGPKLPLTPLQWDEGADEFPRCYAFVPADPKKKRPLRLVVGHYWGVSIFDLPDDLAGKVILRTRLFRGHEGYVTALAVSADGSKLVTVSRDQTVVGWQLDDWAAHPTLGASFDPRDGSLFVDRVDAGSPVWELGLSPGDELLEVGIDGRCVYRSALAKAFGPTVGDVATARAKLAAPAPSATLIFRYRRPGRLSIATTFGRLINRPIWRMFPGSGKSWVLWRYWDYYYACKHNGDFNVGWQRNERLAKQLEPEFIRAERMRGQYDKPAVLAKTLERWTNAAPGPRVPDLPPVVTLFLLGDGKAPVREAPHELLVTDQDGPIRLRVLIRPRGSRPNQQPAADSALLVWVNDFQEQALALGELTKTDAGYESIVTLDVKKFRVGGNRVLAQCNSRGLQRGDSAPLTVVRDGKAPRPRLFGLLVGISDYTGAGQPNLKAREDAEALKKAWEAQGGQRFAQVQLTTLLDGQATRDAILRALDALRDEVRPDDVFLLYLGGHGTSENELRHAKNPLTPNQLAGVHGFLFCCPDLNLRNLRGTTVQFDDLYHKLIKLRCHKIVLLDACHSGAASWAAIRENEAPIRILTQHGIGPVILAACGPDQKALESPDFDLGNSYGLFSGSLRRVMRMKDSFDEADKNHNGELSARELAQGIKDHIQWLLTEREQARSTAGGAPRVGQTPIDYIPPLEAELPLVRWGRPRTTGAVKQ